MSRILRDMLMSTTQFYAEESGALLNNKKWLLIEYAVLRWSNIFSVSRFIAQSLTAKLRFISTPLSQQLS